MFSSRHHSRTVAWRTRVADQRARRVLMERVLLEFRRGVPMASHGYYVARRAVFGLEH
jgi:hypothetical protein